MPKKYDDNGMRLTDCCGAFSTFAEDVLCCKACWAPVPWGQGDGSEHLPKCDGCDEPQEGVQKFTVTDHQGTRAIAHYCSGCADLAERDWNGATASIELLGGPDPYTPQEAYDHDNPEPLDAPWWEQL